jgi:hypothetical protein
MSDRRVNKRETGPNGLQWDELGCGHEKCEWRWEGHLVHGRLLSFEFPVCAGCRGLVRCDGRRDSGDIVRG